MTNVLAGPAPVQSTEPRRNPHGSHIWYELLTTDAEAAKRFYEAIVSGWTVGAPSPDHMGYRQIGVDGGGHVGGMMELSKEMLAGGARPVWLGYVGVDDVDASVNKVEAAGGSVPLPAFDIPEVGRLAMVTDPQGNPFYLMRGAMDAPSNAFSTQEVGHVNWNELSAADPVAARRFYEQLFGWTSDEFMPMGEYGEYRFFAHNGATIGAVSACVNAAPAGWRYYVRVPSIARAVEAVKEAGGSIAMGPHEVPGGDQIIVGHDPQGAEFALVGKA